MHQKASLYRDTDHKMLGGVASGLAEYMNWDVTIVRLVFLFCLFAVQGSIFGYILAWIIIPSKYNPDATLSFGKILLIILFFFFPVIILFGLFSAMFLPIFFSIF